MLRLAWIADEEDAGKTAGAVLRSRFSCSASLVKAIRLHGSLLINGLPSRMKSKIFPGDRIEASLDSVAPSSLHFPDDQRPLWQNEWLIALSKKPGQTVHPSLNHDLEDLCTLISDLPLHPVNRLDRDTSGIVLLALNGHAHYLLSRDHMSKKYLAFVHGRFPAPCGSISCAVGRASDSLILRVPDPAGKEAVTLWKEMAYCAAPSCSLVEFTLLTGRTHQIRLHSLWMGHPLLGDSLYGLNQLPGAAVNGRVKTEVKEELLSLHALSAQQELDRLLSRQALHAASLEFHDPFSKKRIALRDPLPADMMQIVNRYFPEVSGELT